MFGAYLLGIMVFMSVLDFILMGIDKWRAKRGAWRIPEITLIAFAVLFGAPGGYLGMLIFRHKTLHKGFAIGFPLLAAVQIILIGVELFSGLAR